MGDFWVMAAQICGGLILLCGLVMLVASGRKR